MMVAPLWPINQSRVDIGLPVNQPTEAYSNSRMDNTSSSMSPKQQPPNMPKRPELNSAYPDKTPPAMVDLLKTTKGRRMSKKMRKKSSKPLPRKAAKSAAKKAGSRKTSAAKTSTKKAASKRASTKKARPPKASAKKATARKTTASARAPKRPPAAASRAKTPGGPASGALGGLVEGMEAPAFTLPRDGGGQISLQDFAGQKLVLFFYPRADTPGCTLEAISFTRLADAFAEGGTSTIGVSADPVNAQESFKNKYNLTVPLASDEKREMLRAYGVWGKKSMYGKTFEGVLRTTFLVGPDGRIARIWRNVKVDGHAEDVLSVAQQL